MVFTIHVYFALNVAEASVRKFLNNGFKYEYFILFAKWQHGAVTALAIITVSVSYRIVPQTYTSYRFKRVQTRPNFAPRDISVAEKADNAVEKSIMKAQA